MSQKCILEIPDGGDRGCINKKRKSDQTVMSTRDVKWPLWVGISPNQAKALSAQLGTLPQALACPISI